MIQSPPASGYHNAIPHVLPGFALCELPLDKFALCESNGLEDALHIISRKKLLEAAEAHGDLSGPLDVWYRISKKAAWKNLMEVRQIFPTADAVDEFTVFNIKGNAYRLVAEINYQTGRIFLRHVLTHAEYDRGGWRS